MVIFCGAEMHSAPQFLLPFCFCTTVHKDVTERLYYLDAELWKKVQKILGINLKERHLRGGNATRLKYEKKRDGNHN